MQADLTSHIRGTKPIYRIRGNAHESLYWQRSSHLILRTESGDPRADKQNVTFGLTAEIRPIRGKTRPPGGDLTRIRSLLKLVDLVGSHLEA
jgi:hypothetical protein